MSDDPKYFGNPFTDYEIGVQLDFRVKVALDLLKTRQTPMRECSRADVHIAYEMADEFMKQAQTRGYLKSLPEEDDLTQRERRHLRRQARWQVAGQVAAQSIGTEEQSGLAVPVRSPILNRKS